jgi:hypothetical protein
MILSHMFQKVEKSMKMIRRDVEDIKYMSRTFIDEYNS